MCAGFNFGGGGGFSFGTSNAPTTQPGSMFNTNPAAASTQPTTTTGGFSLGSSGFGGNLSGFSFPGAISTTTTAAANTIPASGGGLSLGFNPSSLNATKPSGLSFGGAGGFSLTAQPAVTTSVTTTTATASMFGFSGGLGSTAATTTAGSMQLPFSGGIAPALGGLGASNAPTNAATAQPSLGGFKLGGAPLSATTTTAPTSLLGGLLTGSKPATTSAGALGGAGFSFATPSTQPASTTTTASTGFSLGGMGSLSAGPTTATASTTSSSLAPAAGFGVSSGSLPAAASTATNSGYSLTFPGSTVSVPAPTSVAQAAATITSAGGAVSTAPSMNYRQLEEAINKWTQELEEQEAVFLDQATQVNAWDRLLIENGDMITQLNSNVEKVKTDQQRLDQELDFILGQQSELEDMLKPLELALEQLPPITYQQHADLEREHTYKLAENVDSQLKRMASDLKEIVEHLNSGTSTQDNNDPLIQIAKILNAHVDSLQWIDQKTGVLQRRVEDVARQASVQRKQQQTYR